jgi:hypothetical protein
MNFRRGLAKILNYYTGLGKPGWQVENEAAASEILPSDFANFCKGINRRYRQDEIFFKGVYNLFEFGALCIAGLSENPLERIALYFGIAEAVRPFFNKAQGKPLVDAEFIRDNFGHDYLNRNINMN